MFYHLIISLNFPYAQDADDLIDKAYDSIHQAIVINQGQANEERGFVRLEESHHDTHPSRPCHLISHTQVPDNEP